MIAVSFFFSLFSPITVSEEKARESIAAHKTSLHLSALPTKAGLRFILMPAEQFKSTLTRACRCKLLNCSGARFLRNFAKNPCTLKRIAFRFFLKSGDNQWILTVKTKVLTHKIEILTRFYIIAFANAIIQQTLFKAIKFRI